MNTPRHLLTMSATVQPATITTDSDGGSSYSYSSTYTGVSCLIQPMSSSDMLKYGKEYGLRVSKGYFAPDLNTGTAVVIGKQWRVVANGKSYRVVGEAADPAGQGVLQKVILEDET